MTTPVSRAEFARFRESLRSRLGAPPPGLPVRRLDRTIPAPGGTGARTEVVLSDHDRIRSRTDLVLRRSALSLGRLVHHGDRILRDLFDVTGDHADGRLSGAVTAALRRAYPPGSGPAAAEIRLTRGTPGAEVGAASRR